jgi:hypothetical protein
MSLCSKDIDYQRVSTFFLDRDSNLNGRDAAFFTAWTHRILLVLIYSQSGTSAAWRGWIAGSYNVGGDLRTDPGVSSASQATRVASLQWYCSGRDSQTSLRRPGKARRDETCSFKPVIRDVGVTVVSTPTTPRVLDELHQSCVLQSLWPGICLVSHVGFYVTIRKRNDKVH